MWDIPLHAGNPERRSRLRNGRSGRDDGAFFSWNRRECANMVVDLKPNSVKELAAMVALYRPGPLAHIPRYIRNKFNPGSFEYTHPLLGADSGGNVRRDRVSGPGFEDRAGGRGGSRWGRRTCCAGRWAKRKSPRWRSRRRTSWRARPKRACRRRSPNRSSAEIEPFAGYAFNGAHAACYAMIAYQTAYLKANYPAEYLAALMGDVYR